MNNVDVTVECYDGHVPASAAQELDRLYGNIYSSLLYLQLQGGLNGAHTYIARRGEEVIAVFLYTVNEERIRVLNEGMILSTQEIDRFTADMFKRFPLVSMIEFHEVHAKMAKSSRPYQRFCYSEDFVLQLPMSTEAYFAMLGNATRKNIKKHLNRWQRDFSSFELRTFERHNIQEEQLREIVLFNHMRMTAKNQVSSLNDEEVQKLMRMARQCGLLCVILIEGRICAGTLLFRFGDSFVSCVNAHDPQYNDHRLGTLACYWAICEAIRRRGSTFHFLSGRYAYKMALGGVMYEMDHLAIYRSYWHFLRKLSVVATMAYSGYKREAKIWLLGQEKETGVLPRIAHFCLETSRFLKRMRQNKLTG